MSDPEFLKCWPSLVPAVRSAIGAAVADRNEMLCEQIGALENDISGMEATIARLTKELAEELEKRISAHKSWSGRLNSCEQQLAAAQSALAEEKEAHCVLQSQFENADSNLEQAKLSARHFWKQKLESCESALAEKEKELALLAETHQHSDKLANERGVQLSTERAAREHAESQVQGVAKAAVDGFLERRSEINALRAQLQRAEVDVIMWKDNHSIVCSLLQVECQARQQAEQERDLAIAATEQYMLRSVGAMTIAEGDEGHEAIPRDCPMLIAVASLRAELAATQDTVRRMDKQSPK